MNIDIWSHQFQTSYSESALHTDDSQYDFESVYVKTHDGLNWMSRFDRHPSAVSGLAQVETLRTVYEDQFIRMVPWCVVSGVNPYQEGVQAANVAQAAGESNLVIVDLEPYYHGGPGNPQFWRNDLFSDGPRRVAQFLHAFETAGGEEIWLAPDARSPHLTPVSFSSWVADPDLVTRILPQVYWTDFQMRPQAALDNAFKALARFDVRTDRIAPVFPANDRNFDHYVSAMNYTKQSGALKPSFWQRLNMPPWTAASLDVLDDPWAEEEPVEPPPTDDALTIAYNQGYNRAVLDAVSKIEAMGRGLEQRP